MAKELILFEDALRDAGEQYLVGVILDAFDAGVRQIELREGGGIVAYMYSDPEYYDSDAPAP